MRIAKIAVQRRTEGQEAEGSPGDWAMTSTVCARKSYGDELVAAKDGVRREAEQRCGRGKAGGKLSRRRGETPAIERRSVLGRRC